MNLSFVNTNGVQHLCLLLFVDACNQRHFLPIAQLHYLLHQSHGIISINVHSTYCTGIASNAAKQNLLNFIIEEFCTKATNVLIYVRQPNQMTADILINKLGNVKTNDKMIDVKLVASGVYHLNFGSLSTVRFIFLFDSTKEWFAFSDIFIKYWNDIRLDKSFSYIESCE